MHKTQEEKWKMKAFLIARDAIVKQFQLHVFSFIYLQCAWNLIFNNRQTRKKILTEK